VGLVLDGMGAEHRVAQRCPDRDHAVSRQQNGVGTTQHRGRSNGQLLGARGRVGDPDGPHAVVGLRFDLRLEGRSRKLHATA